MADAKPLLTANGKTVGRASYNAASGLDLQLKLPAGRRLASVQLQLLPADASELDVEYPALLNDRGDASASEWLWASLDWGEERVLTAITLEAAPLKGQTNRRSGGRVRLYSRGLWLPLQPLDSLPTSREQRFAPQCASRLMLETLIEGLVNDKLTGVLVPGPLDGKRIGVRFTRQPCHPSVAIGDAAPFFDPGGPLPAQGLEIDGLLRAINRYCSDNPQADVIPLHIRTANAQPLRIEFKGELEPLPQPPSDPQAQGSQQGQPRPGERLWIDSPQPQVSQARLCDNLHQAAVCLAPLPAGSKLSSLSLWLRAAEQPPATIELALHADAGGHPDSAALLQWRLDTSSLLTSQPGWCRTRLPEPWPASEQPLWLVCRTSAEAVFWYSSDARPPTITAAAWRRHQGAWLPLPQADAWLQIQAGVLDPA